MEERIVNPNLIDDEDKIEDSLSLRPERLNE